MITGTHTLERLPTPKFHETSEKLEEIYQIALRSERDTTIDLAKRAKAIFEEADAVSTDCNSFTAAILQYEYGIPGTLQPLFDIPKRQDYEWETQWLSALQVALDKSKNSPAQKKYLEKFGQFQENFYRDSLHDRLDTFNVLDPYQIEDAHRFGSILAENIAGMICSTPVARTLLISGSSNKRFVDLHTMTMLGVTEDGKDVWIIDKEQIGAEINVTKLSEIITRYSLNPMYKKYGMELSISDFPSAQSYPNP